MVSLGDIAEHLGVHVRTLKRWRTEGQMPRADFEMGGIVRWHRCTIEKWIDNSTGA